MHLLKKIIELLPSKPAIKQVTIAFEKAALWAAFITVPPAYLSRAAFSTGPKLCGGMYGIAIS